MVDICTIQQRYQMYTRERGEKYIYRECIDDFK